MTAKKNLPRLHYITQDLPGKSHIELAREACEAGAPLVQLRLKNRTGGEMLSIARAIKRICTHYNSLLVINDHCWLAQAVDADGVHLGQTDGDHEKARALLGPHAIIGATAYNINDARIHFERGVVDYIGLGTFRPTKTKPEISSFLSLTEIHELVQECSASYEHQIPIIAIGGIQLNDILPLAQAGIAGIAVASMINTAPDKRAVFEAIQQAFAMAWP